MPKHFNMPNQSLQMTRLINQLAIGCPITMVLREAVVNGVEANERFSDSVRGEASTVRPTNGRVLICKDHIFLNKLAIYNFDGEYLSQTIAENNLATLANSGNAHNNNDLATNYGQGAKISYLPHAPQGILYRSKPVEGSEEGGLQFQMMLLEDGCYGLKDFYCEDMEDMTCFPYHSQFSSEISDAVSGTEMVLMGETEDENTWNRMCHETSLSNSTAGFYAGHTLVDFLGNRFWENPSSEIHVQLYNEQGAKGATRRVKSLKEQMMLLEDFGSVSLNGFDGVPDGTTAYYARVRKKEGNKYVMTGTGRFSFSKGWVSFAWKNENYMEHRISNQTRVKHLKDCGIFSNPSDWMIVFELPNDFDGKPSNDRTQLLSIEKEVFFEAFKSSMPDVIKDFLDSQISTDIDDKDISKWLKDSFSDFMLESPKSKSGSGPTGTGKPNKNGGPKKSTPKSQSNKRLKSFAVPKCELITSDEPDSLVEFDFSSYEIRVYEQHPLFSRRIDEAKNEYENLRLEELKEMVYRYILRGTVHRIFETQKIYGSEPKTNKMWISIDQRIEKWKPEILEGCWTQETTEKVRAKLSKKNKERAVLNTSEE